MNCKTCIAISVFFVFSFVFFCFPLRIFAGNYGEGSYSGGNFNVGEETSSQNTSSSDNNNSVNSDTGCHNTVTKGVPNLFQIQTNKDSATLYFAPPGSPYSSFYVAYSTKPDLNEFGVEYNQGYSGGVLKYTIKSLKPNTKYYFKMRAGNGCATGNWGNTMTATTSSSSQVRNFYKSLNTFVVERAKTIVNNLLTGKKIAKEVTPEATSAVVITSAPAVEQKQTQAPAQSQPASKAKRCILWWCF